MKEFVIISSQYMSEFEEMFNKKLKKGWTLHGHTQFPEEMEEHDDGDYKDYDGMWQKINETFRATKGLWQQAFIK